MAESIFEKITQRWFLTEPALFAVYCTHHLEKNTRMKCPIRTGKGVIQYNPHLLPERDVQREQYLRAEVLRIMLKHPYERQPKGVRNTVLGIASDIVLNDNNALPSHGISFMHFGLPPNEYYEWYARELDKMLDDDELKSRFSKLPEGLDAYDDMSGLWGEDQFMASTITEALRDIRNWGSLPGNMVEKIKANLEVKIDYRKALEGFRTSIISSNRSLTRMRPNRRHGFKQMGSKYEMEANLLIVVDASGSVSSTDIENFFGIILSFFKYGVSRLNVIPFDTELKGEPVCFDKSFNPSKEIEITGRGGTNFQAVFDYIKDNRQYDGLIIFTDGNADEPKVNFKTKTKVIWVCQNETTYINHHDWMEKTGRACFIEQKNNR